MASGYNNFGLAIYCTASCLENDLEQLAKELDFFEKHVNVTKVYIESHRGDTTLTKDRLLELKKFFDSRHIKVAGGITPTLGDGYRPGYNRHFGAICYTDQASRKKFQQVIELTASVFNEVILDDFFFTNCGCDDCLSAKGDRSWEEFRLELMKSVSEELVVDPAKAVNPYVKMVIKYPNWNESYASSGYNTKEQPALFDGIYTGTETRDPAISQQHIPRYASFSLMRWMENMAPGRNGGGWFDSLDCTYIDYYLEQANLTVFSKAKELTLFCYSILKDSNYVPALGFQLEKLDELAEKIGDPVGVHVYEPHQGHGENHLYDYLGMLGIPFELSPVFPDTDVPVLVTANAANDEQVIEKMKAHLKRGNQVVMTSGFIEKMPYKDMESFTTLRPTGKRTAVQQFAIDTSSCTFETFAYAEEPITYPVYDYNTNGTWQSVVGINGQNNIPVVMYDHYSKGSIYTLVIPEDFAKLWKMPEEVITKIRKVFTNKLLSYDVEGPGNIGVFCYDNQSLVLESFDTIPRLWKITLDSDQELFDLITSRPIDYEAVTVNDKKIYHIKISPSSFKAFKVIGL